MQTNLLFLNACDTEIYAGSTLIIKYTKEKSLAKVQRKESERYYAMSSCCRHLSHLGSASRPEERWQPASSTRYYEVLDDVQGAETRMYTMFCTRDYDALLRGNYPRNFHIYIYNHCVTCHNNLALLNSVKTFKNNYLVFLRFLWQVPRS